MENFYLPFKARSKYLLLKMSLVELLPKDILPWILAKYSWQILSPAILEARIALGAAPALVSTGPGGN